MRLIILHRSRGTITGYSDTTKNTGVNPSLHSAITDATEKNYFTVIAASSGVFSLESPTRTTNLPGSIAQSCAPSLQ